MFEGSGVALVTPMHENGEVDYTALIQLVRWHLESGTHALIINGTTAEAPTLTWAEQLEIVRTVVQEVGGKIPIIVGTGSNSTKNVINHNREMGQLGVNGFLIVTPYYNKPTQAGLFAHYTDIANQTNLPILLYNVPNRTGVDLLPETVLQLCLHPNIIGIKEASGDIHRVSFIRKRASEIKIFSGEDKLNLPILQLGGNGIISVTGNILPKLMAKMCEYALQGQYDKAQELDNYMGELNELLFVESNPIPVKWALHYLGKIAKGIRKPLTPLDTKYYPALENALKAVGEHE